MKNVLRNNDDGSISHVLYCTFDGIAYYLTDEASRRMDEFSADLVERKYFGRDSTTDLAKLLTGEMGIEELKFTIAREKSLIFNEEIIKIYL